MNLFDKPSAEACRHGLCRGEKRCENRTNHSQKNHTRRTSEIKEVEIEALDSKVDEIKSNYLFYFYYY